MSSKRLVVENKVSDLPRQNQLRQGFGQQTFRGRLDNPMQRSMVAFTGPV